MWRGGGSEGGERLVADFVYFSLRYGDFYPCAGLPGRSGIECKIEAGTCAGG
jgi:hypothetical protein